MVHLTQGCLVTWLHFKRWYNRYKLFVWNRLCNMHCVCQKKIQVNNFFNLWVGLFPLSPYPTCNYSWTGLNRRQRKLSKVGLNKLNLVLPIIHDMYLFKKWFLRSSKWLFISILFSISPFIFSSKQSKNKLMRLICFMLTVSAVFQNALKCRWSLTCHQYR